MLRIRILALSMLVLFAFAVMPSHSYADNYKSPGSGVVVKAKVFGIDQLFVCTAEVPSIYVNDAIPYAPAKNVKVVAPIKLVAATSHSPPATRW